MNSIHSIVAMVRAEIMSKNERRRTPCLTATDSLAFYRRTLCHKTREQAAVLFRFSGFWSKQGSCSDLNRKAKKQEKLSFPPDSSENQLFSVFLWVVRQRKTEKKLIFWWVGGGKLNFSLSRKFFRQNVRGQNLGLETNASCSLSQSFST